MDGFQFKILKRPTHRTFAKCMQERTVSNMTQCIEKKLFRFCIVIQTCLIIFKQKLSKANYGIQINFKTY